MDLSEVGNRGPPMQAKVPDYGSECVPFIFPTHKSGLAGPGGECHFRFGPARNNPLPQSHGSARERDRKSERDEKCSTEEGREKRREPFPIVCPSADYTTRTHGYISLHHSNL